MIARSALQLQASKLLLIILALVSSIVLARAAGPAAFGGYALLMAFAVVLQGATSLGFEDLTLARGPLYGGDSPKARALYRRVLRMRALAISVLTLLAIPPLVNLTPDPLSATTNLAIGCAILYAGFNSFATLGAVVQAARVRPGPTAVLDAAWALGVALSFAALAVVNNLNATTALLATVGWQASVNIGYLIILMPLMRAKANHKDQPFTMRESLMFWLNGLLSIGVGKNSDVLAMQIAGASASPIGRYSAAYNANLTASQVLLQGTGTMLYVDMGRVFSRGEAGAIANSWRIATVFGALFSVPFIMYCMLFPQAVMLVIYGRAYTVGASALVALAATTAMSRLLGGGCNQSLLFLSGRQSQVLAIRCTCVFLNIIFDIVVYPIAGIVGVACVSGGSGLAIVLLEYLLCRRIAPLKVPWLETTKVALPYAVACVIGRIFLGPGSTNATAVASIGFVFSLGTLLMALTRPLRRSDLPMTAPRPLLWILRPFAVS
jgi:O-antigen/teichoic acid export membrane protein